MDRIELNAWKGRIDRAIGLQTEKHGIWNDAVDYFNCASKNLYLDLERVDVHFANWYISNFIPLVYFRDPFIFIKPRHDIFSAFAETMETVVNYMWQELNLKQEFKRCIMSAALMPPGWIKLGYTAKIGQDVAKIDELQNKTLIQGIKQAITGVFKKEKEKTPEEQGVLNEYIKEESIFAAWIPSWNVVMPEGHQVVTQMPYLIEIEDITKTDFIANPIYKNKDKVKANRDLNSEGQAGSQLHKPSYNKMTPTGDDETDIIRLYHIWDRRGQKRFTMSMETDETHFEGDWCYDMEGFPLKPLIFEESIPSLNKSNPYPPNILQPILPQIREQSNARTQMVKWRKRASAIILCQKGLLTEEDMKQLEATEGVQIVYVSNISAFQMSQTPSLPQGVFDVDDIIKEDLQMGTSMGQLMFQAQAGQRTATQAQIGQSGLQLKASARVDVVEDYTTLVAKSLAQLAWQFYDKKKVSEIIGEPVTDNMWLPLPKDRDERRKIIRAELQIMIDAGSAAPPKDETIEIKQAIDVASVVASIAPERLNKGEFVKALMKRVKYAKDLDKIVISNDEEEIQAAQQENELLANNIPQVVSPNENHTLHIQVHSQIPQPTDAMSLHISDHGKFLGIVKGEPQSGVSNNPQEGDIRPPLKSVAPEVTRGGATSDGSDIMQSNMNMGAGTLENA